MEYGGVGAVNVSGVDTTMGLAVIPKSLLLGDRMNAMQRRWSTADQWTSAATARRTTEEPRADHAFGPQAWFVCSDACTTVSIHAPVSHTFRSRLRDRQSLQTRTNKQISDHSIRSGRRGASLVGAWKE